MPKAKDMLAILAGFLEHSPALVSLKGGDGRYLLANPAQEACFGVGRGGLQGRSDDEFLPPGVAARRASRDRAVLQSGQPSRSREILPLPGGEVVLATLRFPYRDASGGQQGVGCVAIDISAGGAGLLLADTALAEAEQHIRDLRRTLEEVKTLAATDRLTGLLNRARMEELVQAEAIRASRYGQPAALIFLDIDHFKDINDTLGHASGDEVLRQTAELVRENVRITDSFGRWGGEEFMLLLPNTDLMQARRLAEKLRRVLADHARPALAPVSGSFGVAEYVAGESWESWVARADAAMYLAKQNGRDRVEIDLGDSHAAGAAAGEHFVHLQWRQHYECGQEQIDRQHRLLFESANGLISALLNHWPMDEIRDILDCLLTDVREHFSAEEILLRQVHYPDLEEHRLIHARLLAKAEEMRHLFAAGKAEFGPLFHFLIYEVIAQHMLGEDRKFFSCFVPESDHDSKQIPAA